MIVKIVTLCVKEKSKDGWKYKHSRFQNAALFLGTLEYPTLAVQYLDTESHLKS